jgi:hypothetical protein
MHGGVLAEIASRSELCDSRILHDHNIPQLKATNNSTLHYPSD